MDNIYLFQTNEQIFSIIMATSVLLLIRNDHPTSLLNIYFLMLQTAFYIKINASDGIDPESLPWWFLPYWYTILYSFYVFVIIYIICGNLSETLSRIVNLIPKRVLIVLGWVFVFITAATFIVTMSLCDPGYCD